MLRAFQFLFGLALLGGILLLIGRHEALSDPEVRRVSVTVGDWPAGTPPVTIALLSDMHLGDASMDADRLTRIVDLVNRQRPDLVAIAGDFIAGHAPGSADRLGAPLPMVLGRLTAPLGVVAVLGNHDHWTGGAATARLVRAAGVTLLDNEAVRRGPLVIGGVDDVLTGHADIVRARAAMRAVQAEPAAQMEGGRGVPVLLTHSPDIAAERAAAGMLVLAGHTHCGQVVLPGIGALHTASRYGQRYRCGIIGEDGRIIVVTAGLGTSMFPLRYGAPPDLWLVTLGPAARRPVN